MDFIGRQRELETLQQFKQKGMASLIVIRGRRRIGKSRLIEEFAKTFDRAYIFSGIPPSNPPNPNEQKEEFIIQMRQHLIPRLGTEDWSDLFWDLARYTETGSVLIAFDEITWMGSEDPSFLGKLKNAWDLHFKKNQQLVLILSGSQSTWIKRNILESTGFVGRVSYRMKLEELPLHRCREFIDSKQEALSSYELFKIFSVTGGVPRYLEEIQPKMSAEENIKQLCFDPGGLLFNEFDQIFHTLFGRRSETYRKILISLGDGSKTLKEIAQQLNRDPGGDLSDACDDLSETGFISQVHNWNLSSGKIGKLLQYRIQDVYTRFYLKFIDPQKVQIKANAQPTLPKGWQIILALQFESLVVNHGSELHRMLKIPEDEVIAAGPYFQTKTKLKEGCQIDYLIQTKFDTLYLCEIKFSRKEISTECIAQVKQKIQRLKRPKGISIRPVLIHVNGVTDELLSRDFFAHIIDFSTFLKK